MTTSDADADITHKNASDNMCICINFVFVVKNMLAPKTNVFEITNRFASMSCPSKKTGVSAVTNLLQQKKTYTTSATIRSTSTWCSD